MGEVKVAGKKIENSGDDARLGVALERDLALFLETSDDLDDGIMRSLDVLEADGPEHLDLLLEAFGGALGNAGVEFVAQPGAGGFHRDSEVRRIDLAEHALQIGRLQTVEILECKKLLADRGAESGVAL